MKYLLLIALTLSGCATIVRDEKKPVLFTGVPEGTVAKMSVPDGQYEVNQPKATFLITRSKQDIPISVTCNGTTRSGVITTHFDPVSGILGNIVFGGIIGLGVDLMGNKVFDPKTPFSLADLCAPKASGDSLPTPP